MFLRMLMFPLCFNLTIALPAHAGEAPKKWVETIAEITGFLESSGRDKDKKFGAVTRDFDCQGL